MKPWYKSKTIWTGLATIATGIGLYFSGEQAPDDLLVSIVGVIFTMLRVYTTQPLSNESK